MKFIFIFFLFLLQINISFANVCSEYLNQTLDIRDLDQIFILSADKRNHFQVERKGIKPYAIIIRMLMQENPNIANFSQADIAGLAYQEFQARHTSAIFDIRQITYRMEDPLEFYDFLKFHESTALRNYISPFERSMSQLYSSYASQGIERAKLLPTIINQDKSETDRVTHFVIQRGIQPVAHVQILESVSEDQKLHFETAFPEETKKIGRQNSTEKIGEIGRLYVTNPNQKHSIFDSLMTTVDGFTTSDASFYQFSVLHEAVSYALHYGQFDRLILQINQKVEKVLQRKKVPLDKGTRIEVSKNWETEQGTETVTEVIYSFDKKAMEEIDDFFLKEVFKRQFEEALANSFLQQIGGAFFEFQQREVLSLIRIGILNPEFEPKGLSVNSSTVYKDPITQEMKGLLFISRQEIEAFLKK